VSLPWWIKAVVLGGVALLLWAALAHHNESMREQGRVEVREQTRQAAEAQATRNRELQRAAELRYTVQAEARERVIVETVTEVRYATQSLAACPVPADAVRLFNHAAGCTRTDLAAPCGAGQPVPAAR
jgi:arginine exporter protein ArgO